MTKGPGFASVAASLGNLVCYIVVEGAKVDTQRRHRKNDRDRYQAADQSVFN